MSFLGNQLRNGLFLRTKKKLHFRKEKTCSKNWVTTLSKTKYLTRLFESLLKQLTDFDRGRVGCCLGRQTLDYATLNEISSVGFAHPIFRSMINGFSPSTFIFRDGSRLDYRISDDCLRYRSPPPERDSLNIPLNYDAISKKNCVSTAVDWRWHSNDVLIIKVERAEVIRKLNAFMRRRPSEFVVTLE